MDPAANSMTATDLRAQIAHCEDQLAALKARLAEVERADRQSLQVGDGTGETPAVEARTGPAWKRPLQEAEYERYGRQLILPTVGIQGQLRIKASAVLVVGAGGLGCPAAAYLAGAGVGTVGLVDGDVVEASNLHRQIAHSTSRIGMHKVDSAIAYLRDLNPLPTYNAHREHLTPQNAEAIMSRYDLVLDCTDHPAARYLVSDACVLLGKPLVSASALRTDGQLMVLNTPPAPPGGSDTGGGPCYRCVFPRPPPADAILSCGEGGILGPVVGVMGVLQALEALRILAAGRHLTAVGPPPEPAASPTLLLFSAPAAPTSPAGFRSVRMRGRRRDCFACGGADSTLSLEGLRAGALDYVRFCGGRQEEDVRLLLAPGERVSATEYHALFAAAGQDAQGRGAAKRRDHLLLDVREREHFEVASIEGAVNVPFSKTQQQQPRAEAGGGGGMPGWLPEGLADDAPIFVVCRVGNDSQTVARQLKDMGLDRGGERFIGDIEGGMRAWKTEVDNTLPFT
ncbi:hypothetical protein GGTG_09191 [Gaeumannomyces tritici R3-111a-1]|uniref:Adenylyltransferase and sulfurtransferase uba4 n=1 Tax=Gaeumannomyces tritici (strain R3-111a-1) TaxID=644352 RepID=J3P6P9_GAET3|nr:hypothetical protein GGTG_09191 [Gaeumannomyces tritici R3-111a-1]EJT72325.1 hypothetical protein GGTG_09191 [Gaeumannomyces tritici R3-111a-1]